MPDDEDVPSTLTTLAHLLLWLAEMIEAGGPLDDDDALALRAWSMWTAELANRWENR